MRLLFTLLLLLTCLSYAGIPEGYKMTEIALPDKGNASTLGICQKDEETMAVVTWEGEIWEYKESKWTRFAEGLMDPNGLLWDKEEQVYYVAQKPELTRIKDSDGDGVADRYENYTDRFAYTKDYHEFHFGPVEDSMGRKYATLNLSQTGVDVRGRNRTKPDWAYMRYSGKMRGWIYRTDRQGHLHPIASGLRSPAGLGVSPKDELFVTDNQGDWLPASALFFIREGGFYGHPSALGGHTDYGVGVLEKLVPEDVEGIREMPAIWFPRDVIANSPGSPVWDTTGGKFGPFEKQIFIGDQNLSNVFRCDVEWVANQYQGFCVPFMDQTKSGTVKMTFDNQGRLWTAQVGRGWNSKGGERSAIQILEWDGKTISMEIYSVKLTGKGFILDFTHPVNKSAIATSLPEIESWHYDYSSKYGSPQLEQKSLKLKKWQLLNSGKSLEIEVDLERLKVYQIKLPNLVAENGKKLTNNTAYYTVNCLKSDTPKIVANSGFLDNKPMLKGSSWQIHDKTRILPSTVNPLPWERTVVTPPANAIMLDSSKWDNPNWKENSEGAIYRAKGDMKTKTAFKDARFHVEFRFDSSQNFNAQLYGNSGFFLMEEYELQILNSFENPVYADGQCGALYGQQPPLVNASRRPGKWQSYDIIMKAPRFDENGKLTEPLRLTVFHNGILIHDDASFIGPTAHRKTKPYKVHGARPLKIQDHKGSPVAFRNIWAVKDIDYDAELNAFKELFK